MAYNAYRNNWKSKPDSVKYFVCYCRFFEWIHQRFIITIKSSLVRHTEKEEHEDWNSN